ncbi:DEAD/DEAH box helicase family protein [Sandaracinobacteroides saxicola]|uniref:Uncharacterized protein n=1 Tax=Sandaracinobacteroides saxicola TaxID=2759707 RepID=A0A7G5IH01_9SPHN|nr:hypothetical protein [Sandaracinobacteroides saxicola]QMW22643.1 hypothetical protein H3309_15245 [Sandaracinobacteroides saxicola]
MALSNYDREVKSNFDALQRELGNLLPHHAGQYALMQNRQILQFCATMSDAVREGVRRFGEAPFSVQEITDQRLDIGTLISASH